VSGSRAQPLSTSATAVANAHRVDVRVPVPGTLAELVVPTRSSDPMTLCASVAALLASSGAAALPQICAVLADGISGSVAFLGGGPGVTAIPAVGQPPEPLGDDDAADPSDHPVDISLGGGRLGLLRLRTRHPAWSGADALGPELLGNLLTFGLQAAGPREHAATPVLEPVADETTAVTRLLAAEEADRRDLTEELHRGVLQALVGARYLLDLGVADHAEVSADAALLARDAVREALGEARSVLRELTPRVTNRSTLASELAVLPSVTVTDSGAAALSAVHAFTAFRLVQRLVHAGAAAGTGGITVEVVDVLPDGSLPVGDIGRSDVPSIRLTIMTPWADGVVSGDSAAVVRHLDRLSLSGVEVERCGPALVLTVPAVDAGLPGRVPVQRTPRRNARSANPDCVPASNKRLTDHTKGNL
jgi:hypothetical protein